LSAFSAGLEVDKVQFYTKSLENFSEKPKIGLSVLFYLKGGFSLHDEELLPSDIKHKKSDLRILLVDDDNTILQLMNTILSDAGYHCDQACDGEKALSIIDKQPIDLVVSDIRLPGLSGVELANIISKKYAETHTILITGYAEYETIAQAINLRPFGYLEKPFAAEGLLELVNKAYAHKLNALEQDHYNRKLKHEVAEKAKELEFRTERLLAEKEILHGIISCANFGLVVVDPTGSIHLANHLGAKLLVREGSTLSSFVGRPFIELLTKQLTPCLTQLFEKVLASETLQELNSVPGQDNRRLSVIAYPLCHEQRTTAVVFIIHDITDKEILQQKVLQSAKLASIGELAAGVAHEINNPLGFVMSNCNSLTQYVNSLDKYIAAIERSRKDSVQNGEALQTVSQIHKLKEELDIDFIREDITSLLKETQDGLKRMSKIVSDLKTFARAESDTPEKHQVNSLIDDALNLVRNETKYKLEIVKNLGELPEITCFPNQLVQVFTNLFINAAHAVEKKGTLTISTSSDVKHVSIAVWDNGSGIPENLLPKIFDPFFTTKEPGKGTGMGLSISHSIVEEHGGTITVHSKEGEGTEFVIDLPLQGLDIKASEKEQAMAL
jgi:two-component system NtrC family sensor kinase